MRYALPIMLTVALNFSAPAVAETTLTNPGVSQPEIWIWDQILAGNAADLNVNCDTPTLDPQRDDERWSAPCRTVTSSFFEKILTQEPWKSAIPFRGVRVSGAAFNEPLDLKAARVASEVSFFGSRFDGGIAVARAQFEGSFWVQRSRVEGGVRGEGMKLASLLLVSNGTVVRGGPLDLTGATIVGNLDTSDSTFEAGIDADSMHVGGNIFLRGSVVRGRALDLAAARIGGQLDLSASAFEEGLSAHTIDVGGAFIIGNGARVGGGPLNLVEGNVRGELVLNGSTFDAGLNANSLRVGRYMTLNYGTVVGGGALHLVHAKIEGGLEMIGSTFATDVEGNSLQVVGDVTVRGGTVFRRVLDLRNAEIGGSLSLSDATFEDGISGGSMKLAGSILIDHVVIKAGALNIENASVGGQISADDSTFEGGIDGTGVSVGNSILLRRGVVRKNLTLAVARTDTLEMSDATFEAEVQLSNIRVASYLMFWNSRFTRPPTISYAHIEGALDLSGAHLPGLDLYATSIAGEFRLARPRRMVQWETTAGETATLNLQGARAKVIRDGMDESGGGACEAKDSWPEKLNLQGFTYEQLAATSDNPAFDLRSRDLCWYESWLARDPYFSFQPYRQMAGALRALGEPDRADGVLFAARERERKDAWSAGNCSNPFETWPWRRSLCFDAVALGVMKVTVGYGIGSGLFRVLWWVAGFTALGAAVLWCAAAARTNGALWCLGASLDRLLPIIKLNEEFSTFFNDPPPRRILRGWQQAYFAVHALVGFLLGSFVVAALAGLTQAA